MLRRTLVILVSVLVVLLVAVVVVVATFDWNRARPWIARASKEHIGREVSIAGDLRVKLSMSPRLVAKDVRVENAAWVKQKDRPMLQADELEVGLSLWPLLSREIEMTVLRLTGATLDLERGPNGEGNWVIAKKGDEESKKKPPSEEKKPAVGFILHELALDDVKVDVAGRKALGIKASAEDVGFGRKLNSDIALESEQLAPLLRLFRIESEDLPKLSVKGRLAGEGKHWSGKDVAVRLGESRVDGQVDVDWTNRLTVKADLRSPLLVVDDILPLFGAKKANTKVVKKSPKAPGKSEEPKDQTFADARLPVESLRLVDADVSVKVDRIKSRKRVADVLDEGALGLKLKGGELRLDPLKVSLANGKVDGSLYVDGRRDAAAVDMKLTMARVDIGRLIDKAADAAAEKAETRGAVGKAVAGAIEHLPENTYGILGGSADLKSHGETPKELARHLSGKAGVAMQDGHLSDVLGYLVAADPAKTIGAFISGDKGSKVDCAVLAVDVKEGVAHINPMFLATDEATYEGKGDVDLGNEKIDVTITPHPKKVSLDSLRGPLHIKGSLEHLSVTPDAKSLLARVGAAIALGTAAAPAAAVLPLVDLGVGKEGSCAKVMKAAH